MCALLGRLTRFWNVACGFFLIQPLVRSGTDISNIEDIPGDHVPPTLWQKSEEVMVMGVMVGCPHAFGRISVSGQK